MRARGVGELWRLVPAAAIAAGAVLLAAGLFAAAYSEQLYKEQKLEDIRVQAGILAEAVTAALSFDDPATADEYVQALRVNSNIEAVGVYDGTGSYVAGYALAGARPPPQVVALQEPYFESNRIVTVTPVRLEQAEIGMVYLRAVTVPLASRLVRYGVIALFAFMAVLVVAVLGVSHAALRAAAMQLDDRKRALEASNRQVLLQISERNRAEEALRQSQKMEAIGQLTGGVAHDFNNLLAAMTSGLRLLDSYTDPARRAEVMSGMRQAVDRGARLTRQLLSFSRRRPVDPQVVFPGVQLAGMRELLQRTLREDIQIDINLPDDLWPIEVDPSQLELAIINVAVNSRDAMPEGGVISIRGENVPGADGTADAIRLVIRDGGQGMSPEAKRRAFEPFYTTKEVGKGTGLGLSQVYGFATQSGGSAEIESEPGKGAAVILTLPRTLRRAPSAAPTRPDMPSDAAPVSASVLMVEDDDAVAMMVAPLIEQLGYACVRVASADDALARLNNGEVYDLLFSDIVMPGGMNGLQLAREVHERAPAVAILLTTGYSAGVEDAAAEFPVLRKPYQPEELERALRTSLQPAETPAASPPERLERKEPVDVDGPGRSDQRSSGNG
jgi:signal transduction histidine kinase/CheY-like chemotaxis protein